MEALINGGPECAPDGGRNQLNQFVKHLEGRDDGVFQDQFHRDALMQHAGPSSRPTRLAEFNENQFVEEFNNFNVGGPGPMQESFRFREMKSELEHMMDRQAPPMAMGAGDWANEFGQFQQQPQMLRGGNDAEFEAAFRAASSKDWGHEFVMQQQGPHVQALDAEFDRLEQAFSIAKIADPLEAAWTEQFSRVSESLDVKGKGKVVDDSEFAQWDSEFSKIKDTLEANGEISPEMLDKFNSVWKNLAEKDGDYIDPASHSWASEYEDFNTTGSVIDPDPVTAPLAPYEFEENNPFLAHGDPMAEGLRIVKEGGNLSTAALAFRGCGSEGSSE
ncbi:hypothetical protein BC829DRAFT_128330 [Chytridium lagenaria]|nr:hypothetical protein BC829DRAFT_128330 [Chytridium lagenaria]